MKSLILFTALLVLTSCQTLPSRTLAQVESVATPKSEKEMPPPDSPRLKEWPERIAKAFYNVADRTGLAVTTALFDRISDIPLLNRQVRSVQIKVRTNRDVYENHDVLNNWSVIDHFEVQTSFPIFNYASIIGENLPGYQFSIGGSGGIELINIRQVSANRYDKLPTLSFEENRLRRSEWFEYLSHLKPEATQSEDKAATETLEESQITAESFASPRPIPTLTPGTDPDAIVLKPDNAWYSYDPSIRPRFRRFLNPFTLPFKIPFKANGIKKLQQNEIISYSGNGAIELGNGIGFNLIPFDNVLSLTKVSATYRTYLRGEYRITILKEDDRYVRVKVTRKGSMGHGVSLSRDTKNNVVFNGIVLFEGSKLQTNVLKQSTRIMPFDFATDASTARQFDVGYRYDLEDPDARLAFEHAVLGRFALSEEIAAEVNDKPETLPTVSRLFEVHSKMNSKSTSSGLSVSLLYRRAQHSGRDLTDAVIDLPDGTHHIFKVISHAEKEWTGLFGLFKEKTHYNFVFAVDLDREEAGESDSEGMIAEGLIEDWVTTSTEINAYKKIVENAVARSDIFPDFPRIGPREDGEVNKKIIYGRSSFYYGLNLSKAQLRKFLNTNPASQWSLLEKAFELKPGRWSTPEKRTVNALLRMPIDLFNAPLSLSAVHIKDGSRYRIAKRFHRLWEKAQKQKTIREKYIALAKIFQQKEYGYELMRLLQLSLDGEEISYFVSASNSSFGRIQQRGKTMLSADRILNLTDERINFDRIGGGTRTDVLAVVSDFQSQVDSAEGVVRTQFKLSDEPEYLLFRLVRNSRFKKSKTLQEVIYLNRSQQFKKGANELVLNPKALFGLGRDLGEKLTTSDYYVLNIAFSRDRKTWGQVSSTRFFYQKPRPPVPEPTPTPEVFPAHVPQE